MIVIAIIHRDKNHVTKPDSQIRNRRRALSPLQPTALEDDCRRASRERKQIKIELEQTKLVKRFQVTMELQTTNRYIIVKHIRTQSDCETVRRHLRQACVE